MGPSNEEPRDGSAAVENDDQNAAIDILIIDHNSLVVAVRTRATKTNDRVLHEAFQPDDSKIIQVDKSAKHRMGHGTLRLALRSECLRVSNW